ncbi:MAG: transglutaminase domain-containing protein [Nanoarchaeota archaeon]
MSWWRFTAGTGMAAMSFQALKKIVKSNSLVGSYVLGMIGGASGRLAYQLLTPEQRSELEEILGQDGISQEIPPEMQEMPVGIEGIKESIRRERSRPMGSCERIKDEIRTSYRPAADSTLDTQIRQIARQERQIERLREQLGQYEALNLGDISERYQVILNDSSVTNPFVINSELLRVARQQAQGARSEAEKAGALFHWFEANIPYDERHPDTYRTSLETMRQGTGVCGESAYLYVCMARAINLRSAWAVVERDFRGQDVHHACAAVKVEGELMLVDPAYHLFDAKHKRYHIMNDSQAIELFRSMRG